MVLSANEFHKKVLLLTRTYESRPLIRQVFKEYYDDVVSRYGLNVDVYLLSDEIFEYIAPYIFMVRIGDSTLPECSDAFSFLDLASFDFLLRLEQEFDVDLSTFYDRLFEYQNQDKLVYSGEISDHSDIYTDVRELDLGYEHDLFYLFQYWLCYGSVIYLDHDSTVDLSVLFEKADSVDDFNYKMILFIQRCCLNTYGYVPYFKQNMLNWINACIDDSRSEDIIDMYDLYLASRKWYVVEGQSVSNDTMIDAIDFSMGFTNEKNYTYRDLLEHLKNYV